MRCHLNRSSSLAIIFHVGASHRATITMHRMPFVFIAAKRRRVVTLARTNVGITTRGGFIIPANDLTKRTRRPGMDRVESRFPVLSSSRPIIVFLSPSLSLAIAFPRERSYSPIYILHSAIYVGPVVRSAHLYTP